MRSARETSVVRAGTLVLAAAAAIAPTFMETPAKLPSVALESELILYAERAFALGAILLFVLVVVARGWKDELPIALSQRGAEWAHAAGESDRELGTQVAEVRARVKELETGLERVSEIVMVEPRE